MHALLKLHSLLEIHSGRQYGGDPINPVWHRHCGSSPFDLQTEFGPHGDGSHGAVFGGSSKMII